MKLYYQCCQCDRLEEVDGNDAPEGWVAIKTDTQEFMCGRCIARHLRDQKLEDSQVGR